jgi:hypothetical protein
MKLYRLSVIVGNTTIERGVWADNLDMKEGLYIFYNDKREAIQSYPAQLTFITSIETKEDYDTRKAK